MDEQCGVPFADYDKLTKTLTPLVKAIKTGNQSAGLTLDCHAGVNEVRDLQFPIFTSRGGKATVLQSATQSQAAREGGKKAKK